MSKLSKEAFAIMAMCEKRTFGSSFQYVGILGKVCGDTWQSMSGYLAKYVDLLYNLYVKIVFS